MVVQNVQDLEQVRSFIAQSSKTLAFDIETTGLNTRKDSIIGFGLSDGKTSYYIAHLSWDGEKLVELIPRAACTNLLRGLLSFSSLVTWNGTFDINFTYHYFGVDLAPILGSEAMLACHTTNENTQYALKTQAALILGEDATEEQANLKANLKKNKAGAKEYYKADLDIMAEYCMKDCVLTLRLDEHYKSQMDENLRSFYEDEVMALYREVTIIMERKGVPVDVELLRRTDFNIQKDLARLEAEVLETLAPTLGQFQKKYLNKMYPAKVSGNFARELAKELNVDLPLTPSGAPSLAKKNIEKLPSWHLFRQFMEGRSELPDSLVLRVQKRLNGGEVKLNLASRPQMQYVFFTILRERPISFTDRGAPQVDAKFIKSIAHKYDFGPSLLSYYKLFKVKSSYIDRYLEGQEDGVYYPRFQQHRTTSGRYGGDLQQLPKPFEEDEEVDEVVRSYVDVVRHFFIAGEGHKFIDADYNSLEVVVFADDAGDEALLDMIREDKDFYSTVALGVHNLEDQYSADKSAPNYLKKMQPKLRQDAKVYGLGIRYGMGDWKLSKTLNIDIKEAASIIEDYYASYPKLKQKMDFYLNEAKTKGRLINRAGRVRHLPQVKEIYEQHGDDILDVRKIYKKYPAELVEPMKKVRKKYNNLLNNALNFPIQSMAASIVNRASIQLSTELKRRGLTAYICMQVHDELCIRAPEHEVEQIKPIMKDIMENTTKLDVPLIAEPNVADTYGDVK